MPANGALRLDTAPATPLDSPRAPSLATATGLIIIVQSLVMLIPIVVLGGAIGWPASLDEPAAVVLPLIREQRGAVAAGYFAYLLASVLIIPMALLLHRLLDGQAGALLAVAAAFGALAGVLKGLGIVRWLVLMPALADTYVDPATSATTRETVTVMYDAFNRYAGGVGENLGVMLFAGLFTVLLAAAIMRSPDLPRWLGPTGLATGALTVAGIAEVFGVEPGGLYLTAAGTIWQVWFVALAVVLLRTRPRAGD